MMFERFTKPARAVVVNAQAEARALGSGQIGSEHLLLAILSVDGAGARALANLGVHRDSVRAQLTALGDADAQALEAIGIDLESVRRRAEETFGPGALDRQNPGETGRFGRRRRLNHLPFDAAAKRAIELSLREAIALDHNYIGTEHLLLGLFRDERSEAMALLRRLGLTQKVTNLRETVIAELNRAA